MEHIWLEIPLNARVLHCALISDIDISRSIPDFISFHPGYAF